MVDREVEGGMIVRERPFLLSETLAFQLLQMPQSILPERLRVWQGGIGGWFPKGFCYFQSWLVYVGKEVGKSAARGETVRRVPAGGLHNFHT